MPTPMLYCTGQILQYAPAVPKSSVPIASPPVAPRPITRVVVSWSNDHRRPSPRKRKRQGSTEHAAHDAENLQCSILECSNQRSNVGHLP